MLRDRRGTGPGGVPTCGLHGVSVRAHSVIDITDDGETSRLRVCAQCLSAFHEELEDWLTPLNERR